MAEVIAMRNESTTVKSLRLKVQDKNLTFKAGQWWAILSLSLSDFRIYMKHEWSVLFCSSDRVDTFLPGLEKVGGFSMCSSPGMLKREGTLDLAVKHSEHPPAKWIHQKVRIARQFKLYPSTLISQCSLSITFCLPGNLFMICPWTPLCCFQSFN